MLHFAYRWNKYGQIGNGSTANVHTPILVAFSSGLIDSQDEIINVTAGWRSTIALSKRGKLYSWGYNSLLNVSVSKQGISDKKSYSEYPRRVLIPEDINTHEEPILNVYSCFSSTLSLYALERLEVKHY